MVSPAFVSENVGEGRDGLVLGHGNGVGEDGHVVRDEVADDEIVVIVEPHLPVGQSGYTNHTSSIPRRK